MRLLKWLALFVVLLLPGCGNGGGLPGDTISGTWLVTRAATAGATTISCPGGLQQNGTEIYSCSPHDTMIFRTDGYYDFDQLASGVAVPSSVTSAGYYTLSGNTVITQAIATTYTNVNGAYNPTGSTPSNISYTYARSGNTLTLTTPQGITLTLTRQ